MSTVINTNASALGAVRSLSKTSGVISQAMERLSTGRRINSAADDAAGLAIVSNLTKQITGTEQAIKNANDGISLTEVMDSALGEMTNILQRARQLSVYSANGTLSDADRDALDLEYTQLMGATGELQRIVDSTSFNGISLLDNSITAPLDFQVGWESGDTIAITAQDMNLGTIYAGSGSVDTVALAQAEIPALDTTIDSVVAYRATLGAYQNRFETTISNLESLSEKSQIARSRIEDADYSSETSNLARGQVLQQAGMTMLARSNAATQQVLQLLQG